jgi:hypothetical protein
MLDNQTLWDTAVECHAALAAAGVPHAIVGFRNATEGVPYKTRPAAL